MEIKSTIHTEIIDAYMKQHNISKVEFCKRCQIGNRTLQKLYTNDIKIRIPRILRILKVLNVKFSDFITYSCVE